MSSLDNDDSGRFAKDSADSSAMMRETTSPSDLRSMLPKRPPRSGFSRLLGRLIAALPFSEARYGPYTARVRANQIRRLFRTIPEHVFAFVLSPPFCGSTLLMELLSTSPVASATNYWGTREGQTLPTVRHILFDNDRRWDPALEIDWRFVRSEWVQYWDQTDRVLIEKSPPHLVRARALQQNFIPARFLVSWRNTYAHSEGMIARGVPADKAAARAIKCLRFQRGNLELENALAIPYETDADRPRDCVASILAFLPELESLDWPKKFHAHNRSLGGRAGGLANTNQTQIDRLTPLQLSEINGVFKQERSLIESFGYDFLG
jgi:hypothetical protein